MTVSPRFRAPWLVLAAAAGLIFLAGCVQISPNLPPPGGGRPAPTPAPSFVEASYVTSPECSGRTGNNGGRGFVDIGLNQCYACPSGYNRTVFDVRGNNACERGGPPPFGTWVGAEPLGRPGCTGDTFQVGSACYRRPSGTVRDTSAGRTACRRG